MALHRSGRTLGGFGAAVVMVGIAFSLCASTAVAASSLRWSAPRLIDRGAPFGHTVRVDGIACPTVTECVAVDAAGQVLSSIRPQSAAAWTVAPVDRGTQLTGVSCASPFLCAAVDSSGGVLTSASPTGGAGAWTRQAIDPGGRL